MIRNGKQRDIIFIEDWLQPNNKECIFMKFLNITNVLAIELSHLLCFYKAFNHYNKTMFFIYIERVLRILIPLFG